MTSKLKTDVLETVSGSGTIALSNQLTGMTTASLPTLTSAEMPAGSVVQVVTKSYSNNSEVQTSSTSYVALGSAFELAITPKYATSLIICDITKAGGAMNSATYGSSYTNINDSRSYTSNSLREFDAAGGTSAITYGMSFKGQGGNTVFAYHGQSAYHITLTEIKQ